MRVSRRFFLKTTLRACRQPRLRIALTPEVHELFGSIRRVGNDAVQKNLGSHRDALLSDVVAELQDAGWKTG